MPASMLARPRGGLWDHPDFIELWVGQALSAAGSRFTREGMPTIAALLLGASGTDLALLVALSTLPGVALSPLAGAWIDHTRRRRRILIGRDQLLDGNGKLAGTESAAEIAGPALAGSPI